MKDYSELKMLAENATPGPWAYDGSYVCPARTEDGTTYVELWRSIADCHQPENTKFIAATNPAAVLELIYEVEALKGQLECADEQVVFLEKQVKKLILESVSLKKEAARYRWLRDSKRFDDEDPLGQLACGETEGEDLLFDSDLDHAIDMYMVWIKDKDIK